MVQLDRACRGWTGRRFVKRRSSRRARREARRLLDAAPVRRTYRGWAS